MSPQKIREYAVIGGPFSGTYGSVWIGRHETLDWKRAFKQLHGHVLPGVIKEEAQKLKAVKSPYVVQIHDFFNETGWGDLLVMEFCPVGLDQHLVQRFGQTDGHLPFDEARKLLDGILRGLIDAHNASIVHGDIKPANVRFGVGATEDQLGAPKLSDFGAARSLRETTATIKGSTNWMAPELLRGEDASKATDYFSFGVLAYLLLSGRHPFFANDPSCLTSEENNIANLSFVPVDLGSLRKDISPKIASLVMDLLSRDAEARVRSVEALTAALSEAWEPIPETPSRPQTAAIIPTEEESALLRTTYQQARLYFFVQFRPREAVDLLDEFLENFDWRRFEKQGLQPLANCWSLKGFIKNSSGRYDDAIEAATNGLAVDEFDVNSLHVRGFAQIQLGRNQEAKDDLERALAITTDSRKRAQLRELLFTIRDRE